MESLQERADGSRVFGQTVLRETGGTWVKLEEIFHILAGLERRTRAATPFCPTSGSRSCVPAVSPRAQPCTLHPHLLLLVQCNINPAMIIHTLL